MINKYKNSVKKRGSSWVVPNSNPKKKIIEILKSENLSNAIYLIMNKKFTYDRELRTFLAVDNNFYTDRLLSLDIIQSYCPNEEEINFLIKCHNLGEYHVNKMKFYTLNDEIKRLLQHPLYYELILENVTKDINILIDDLQFKYNTELERQKQKDIKEKKKEFFKLRKAGVPLESINPELVAVFYND